MESRHNCLTAQICISLSNSMNANKLFSHELTQNGFQERDSVTFAGKSGFRLVLKITKKVNALQHSLTYFAWVWGTKDLKASFLKEHGVLASTLPTLCVAACSGHSPVISTLLPVPIPIQCLSSPLSPREDFPTLRRTALERGSKVFASQPHHPGVSGRLTTTTAPLHLPGGFGLSSPPRNELCW